MGGPIESMQKLKTHKPFSVALKITDAKTRFPNHIDAFMNLLSLP